MGNIVLSACNYWSGHVAFRAILVDVSNMLLIYWQNLEIVFMSFDLRELVCTLLDLDHWVACGPMSKCAYSYGVI